MARSRIISSLDMSSGSGFRYRNHPHLYEINTWAWLEELSAKYGRPISLGDVPANEWDEFARLGFDFVWLMGVWERSAISRHFFQTDAPSFTGFDQALPGWKLSEIVGSPYSVRQYHPDARIGSWGDLDHVREQLRARGMGLILDFVANHTAPDHPWVAAHPEYYLRGSQADFRRDSSAFYLPASKAEQQQHPSAEPTLFAHGRDPYFPPWRDVLQLDYFNPAARAALIGLLQEISRHCDGVRCDMAMLVLNDVFARTWEPLLGGRAAPKREFWSEVIAPLPRDFLWLAEVYWNCEEPIQALGFQFTYDKGLYDALRDGNAEEVRARVSGDIHVQSRCARFLENHDEARSAAVFGAEKLEAVATLLATLPGMRFYHHGQLDGRKIHLPIPLAYAATEEPNAQTRAFYERVLKLSNEAIFHSGEWKLLDVSAAGDESCRNLIAYEWRGGNAQDCVPGSQKNPAPNAPPQSTIRKIVVVNLGHGASQGRVHIEAISPGRQYAFFDELHDVRYIRAGDEIAREGLYIRLDSYRAHLFDVKPQNA